MVLTGSTEIPSTPVSKITFAGTGSPIGISEELDSDFDEATEDWTLGRDEDDLVSSKEDWLSESGELLAGSIWEFPPEQEERDIKAVPTKSVRNRAVFLLESFFIRKLLGNAPRLYVTPRSKNAHIVGMYFTNEGRIGNCD